MLKFFKNLLQINKADPIVIPQTSVKNDAKSEIKHELQEAMPENNEDHYLYGFVQNKLSDFEIKLYKLRSYDGFTRQRMLEHLKHCFDAELFPHLLERLSDYVEINRQLAAQHVLKWSEHVEFSQLCVHHFLLIATLQNRDRTEPEAFKLLLSEVSKQTHFFSEIFSKQQGVLPRTLLKFILQYQWVDKEKLFELCRLAKDQQVRKYWLDEIIQNQTEAELLQELKQSKLKDVQYQLFDHLYQNNALALEDLILFWKSKFPSMMDYAYFALRQKAFNFDQYFIENPIKSLTRSDAIIQAKQWILLKGDDQTFFEILKKIDSKDIINAYIFKALKQQYLNIEQCLKYYQNTQQKIEFWYLIKLKKITQQQMNIDEIQQFICLIEPEILFTQRLSLIEHHGIWDQLYWLVLQKQHIKNSQDQAFFDQFVECHLHDLHYAIYGAQWTASQKQEMALLLPTFVQSYPQIFAKPEVKKISKPYLCNEN